MKSVEFISEDTEKLKSVIAQTGMTEKHSRAFLETVVGIKKNCQPFLNEIDKPFSLLRGLRPTPDWSVQKIARLSSRQSMSTPRWLHDELNKLFVRKFKVPFRNSVFCTGSDSQASVYGMIFCIFPIGNYQYAWSPEYRDLYQTFDEYRSESDQQTFTDMAFNIESYTTTGLNEAIMTGHEIMMYTDKYYALNMNHIGVDRQTQPLLNAIQEYWQS